MAKSLINVPVEIVEKSILLIRGQKVMLDRDLARLYGVDARVLNQAVKRNLDRFPEDFMFQLTPEETSALPVGAGARRLRSQNVILKNARGLHQKYRPYAFTEHGILMLSSVLRSDRAVQVNIQIMRTFVRLRELLASNAQLTRRLDDLESNYDVKFKVVFTAIKQLMSPATSRRKQIGFRPKASKK